MKRITNLLCAVILSALVYPAFAQEQAQKEIVKNKSKDNWFISLGGGLSILQGEQDNQAKSLVDRFRYSGELSVGKWFNPYFGSRIELTAGGLRGFNFKNNADIGGKYFLPDRSWRLDPMTPYDQLKSAKAKNGEDGFWQEFNYGAATFDLMVNLTNLFRGYWGGENAIDIIPYIGGGV
ncbi:MAG: hypothetical protein LBQ84_01015, partial [Flavobacteriaceae bacterium]|nr:hypothetical protein [Flavobacteriaceae bacterium]